VGAARFRRRTFGSVRDEIDGRVGGLIPTKEIALRDLVMGGGWSDDVLGGSPPVPNPDVAEQLWGLSPFCGGDVVLMASNSGVNGSSVGFAEQVKQQRQSADRRDLVGAHHAGRAEARPAAKKRGHALPAEARRPGAAGPFGR
jgi:uncharacterized phosphosugar-binding protein